MTSPDSGSVIAVFILLHTEHLIDLGGFSIYHHPIFEVVMIHRKRGES
jgi:hypothetical protein